MEYALVIIGIILAVLILKKTLSCMIRFILSLILFVIILILFSAAYTGNI